MIKYALKCDQDHSFDSWFADASSFEKLQKAGHVSCVVCGSSKISKSLMAPGVRPARKAATATSNAPETQGALSAPASPEEAAVAQMRKHVEENADYVGSKFAQEARKMHDGDREDRPIYGEAKLDEAKKLIEDGIAVAPLPFMPKSKAN